MTRSALICMAVLAFSGPAFAQSIVLGSGEGHDCYLAVERGDPGSPAAMRLCKRALRGGLLFGTDRAATLSNLGILHLRRGEAIVALENFDQALTLDPALADTHINRGASMIYLGRFEDAVTALTESLALGTSREPEALYNRALAFERLGKLDAAYDDLSQTLRLRPGWEPAERTLARYVVIEN